MGSGPATAPVIDLATRRNGRPSKADDLLMEMSARQLEERRMARELQPLINRLYLIAREHGPAAHQTVAAVEYLTTRHARRWTPPSPEAA